ncbi:MAG: dienelactone hydrolase family protein [Chloroflexi bacterium]|nr:dienelactone hydrolase family protein [Chloroflexota bacterium]
MAGIIVSFPSNGHSADGYLSLPASGRGPGVIVIQEWWGLVPHIRNVADRFAAEGYVALAPDLYHGRMTTEPDAAGKMMMSLKLDETAREMSGAFQYLKQHEACTGKVGDVGFCLGGGLSLYLATLQPLDACVVYYGVLPGAQPDISKLKAPVMGHYAEHDDFASPQKAHELEAQIRAQGGHAQFYVYDGVEHAFFNDDRPEVYNKGAAETSWARTMAFLKEHLS